jgi:hypothetical protein
LTRPLITPPASTVSKHSIPDWTIALTAVPGDHSTINGPYATQIVPRSISYVLKSKRTAVKGMSENVIRIPTSTTKISKRKPNSWFVHLYAIGIDPEIRPCTVFLSDPTAGLIASTKATDMSNGLGQKVSNAPGGS